MRIGILADIHEHFEHLRWAISTLREHDADRLVFLGDLFETGHRLEEPVGLLVDSGTIGVWGNHDFGLCHGNARPEDYERYGRPVVDFMGTLKPRLEIEGCLFTHVEPWLDPANVEDLWYFEGAPETTEQLARIFTAVSNRVIFVGHYHRWLHATPVGIEPWSGDGPIILEPGARHFVVVNGVFQGKCAMFDTGTSVLTPFDRSWSTGYPPNNPDLG